VEPEAPDREPTFDERLGAAEPLPGEGTLAAAGVSERVDVPPEPRPSATVVPGRAAAPPVIAEQADAFPPPAAIAPARVDAPPPTPGRTPEARVAVAVAKATEPPPSPGRGEWTVQVAATRDPRHAQSIAKRLTERGYQANVKQVKRAGETFFRVRVGKFPTPEEANKMVSRLRREPGVPEAFVASD
jgi:septal ring-binding cell division protein DamX